MRSGEKERQRTSSGATSAKDAPDLDDLIIEERSPRRKKRVWKSIAFVVGVVVILFSLNAYLISDLSSRATLIELTYVQRLFKMTAQGSLTATGYVVARRAASVASKGTGRLTSVRIDVGDEVTEGQILATVEQADVKAKLLQAQARLDVAKAALANAQPELREATRHYQRTRVLSDQGLVTQEERDVAEARLRRSRAAVRSSRSAVTLAQAEIQAVQIELENTLIRAPFDGTVIQKFAEVGEMVAPMAGAANSRGSVANIADLQSLQVEADVSEPFMNSVRLGQPAHVTLEAVPNRLYHGSVSQIVPTADRTKAAIPVRVRIDDLDDKVFPDMSATVTFLDESSSASEQEIPPDTLGVYPGAIVTRKGQTMVLRIENNVVSEVPVAIGSSLNGLIPVQGEVIEGDAVVMDPPEDLAAGGRVEERLQDSAGDGIRENPRNRR